jgi:hypothetical protein
VRPSSARTSPPRSSSLDACQRKGRGPGGANEHPDPTRLGSPGRSRDPRRRELGDDRFGLSARQASRDSFGDYTPTEGAAGPAVRLIFSLRRSLAGPVLCSSRSPSSPGPAGSHRRRSASAQSLAHPRTAVQRIEVRPSAYDPIALTQRPPWGERSEAEAAERLRPAPVEPRAERTSRPRRFAYRQPPVGKEPVLRLG